MTDNNHPITPPEELLQEWCQQGRNCMSELNALKELATQAARWGAGMELEACCEWLEYTDEKEKLRAARRPKPPSLKEQALQALENADGADHPVVATVLTADQHALIRKALEKLDD